MCRHELSLPNICAKCGDDDNGPHKKESSGLSDMSVTDLAKDGHKLLKIGHIQIGGRALLAPMSGVTDAPFRRLVAALGAGLVVSEMTASDDLVHAETDEAAFAKWEEAPFHCGSDGGKCVPVVRLPRSKRLHIPHHFRPRSRGPRSCPRAA
jgi:Dihydrouridine synthase (Dus)